MGLQYWVDFRSGGAFIDQRAYMSMEPEGSEQRLERLSRLQREGVAKSHSCAGVVVVVSGAAAGIIDLLTLLLVFASTNVNVCKHSELVVATAAKASDR